MIRNSTIIPKKRALACGHFDFAFSKNMCKSCATIKSTARRISAHEEAEHTESRNNLIEDLDAVFSKYIRTKYLTEDGFVYCYTSGRPMLMSDAQCGHFIPRGNLSTRWDERNCRPQSKKDNEFLGGNLDVFRKKLEEESPGITDELMALSKEVYSPSISDLREMVGIYRQKLKIAELKFK